MMLSEKDLLDLKFSKINTFTVADSHTYDLGRRRMLSISSVGTPNEILCIIGTEESKKITDVIVLHNFDYDGYITREKLSRLIDVLDTTNADKPTPPEEG